MTKELDLDDFPLIGMIHLPRIDNYIQEGLKDLYGEVIPTICSEAQKLEDLGFSAILSLFSLLCS